MSFFSNEKELINLFPLKINVTSEPFETSQANFVAILEQIKIRMSKNLYLEILFNLIPLKINVTSEPLGAAVCNFAGKFHNYIRAN